MIREDLARVICGAHTGDGCKPWEEEDEDWRETYRDMADAVLEWAADGSAGVLLPGMIAIPRPRILTGPKHQSVDEATASYLREAARRVRDKRFWGSGVTRLVADLLGDVADVISASERDGGIR